MPRVLARGTGNPPPVEITDLLGGWDTSGVRRPVPVEATAARLAASGQHRAARLVRRMPARDGLLDPAAVDALLLRVHYELQRFEEELQLARRIAQTVAPWVAALRGERPVRVVDVGCGLGYVLRWLAAHDALGPDVELVGVDLDRRLVAHAAELAAAEELPCRFVAGDAFAPGVAAGDGTRCVMVSSGLLHHLPAGELPAFFAAQRELGVAAFAHWDIRPGPWSTLGAWVLHAARMREPVSRHDGVLSARRAHPAATLLDAARAGAPGYQVSCADGPAWLPRPLDVLRPVTGVREPAGTVRVRP
ncbi:methyltransferase domain-containing protein [Phytohabitans sp. ZYX-F-186]|uniref:Methyltransferase domain-containing protein n=1 Tax=Phytohabitans maris TaxID=3071409 RepID=A0ABU0ZCT4_9ACTN|nr:methyltransferase domain-containing protein [Phytohabitans sp. ZYX-F-186]MDQ7904875.1 methyltransferase domain-containing protein [Phytohabitans sp. ZYX-F-186]